MTTRQTRTGADVMAQIVKMMDAAGSLNADTVVTDCIILTRTEGISSGDSYRERWHPLAAPDEVRERGMLSLHHDDALDEEQQRREQRRQHRY